jgi:hypothetical protein
MKKNDKKWAYFGCEADENDKARNVLELDVLFAALSCWGY